MDRFKFISDMPLGAQANFGDLPKNSGVYSFYDKNEIIYIGKAINIRDRVKNHFNQPSYRDDMFINKVNKIGYLETGSEIEALILEANLIKKYQPKFNVVWRDDKNYFYVALRQAQGKPYVFITHQKEDRDAEYIGPFVEGTALKMTLRFLRRVFPYYTAKKHSKNKCTWCHLGLCPGPLLFENPPSPEASEGLREYKKNIKKLVLILKGKRSAVLNSLKREMIYFSKTSKFEEAAKVRDRIHNLQQVMSHAGVIEPGRKNSGADDTEWQKTQKIIQGLTGLKKEILKIECYDVSNMQGKSATGSMVAFVNGQPDKNQYRKFHMHIEGKPNDIAMLAETLQRRFAHSEWKYPEIILIDGGIAQLNVAIDVKNQKKESKSIKVISIAKRNKDLYIEGRNGFVPLKTLPQGVYNLILRLDDEAHRFAIAYHKKLRKKNLLH